MLPKKSVHCAIGLDYLEEAVRRQGRERGGKQTLIEEDGKPLAVWEALSRIRAFRVKGYKVFPPCESIDSEGRCLGHPKE